MRLAKASLDVGLYTNDIEAMRSFYEEEVGLAYEELLKAGGGVHQHRLSLRGSVLKLNADREHLAPAPSCFRGLVIADEGATDARPLVDPDGLPVELVPKGAEDVTAIGIRWATPDPEALGALLVAGFGAEIVAPRRWRVGTTVLLLEEDAEAASTGGLRALGFRYLTVQVRDVRADHAALVEHGWTEATAPIRLGDVAFISFVRAPDGSWIEVSQRASLTGPLP